VKPYLCPS